jgi:hypothetical protein
MAGTAKQDFGKEKLTPAGRGARALGRITGGGERGISLAERLNNSETAATRGLAPIL